MSGRASEDISSIGIELRELPGTLWDLGTGVAVLACDYIVLGASKVPVCVIICAFLSIGIHCWKRGVHSQISPSSTSRH
jgi:predicted RNA methylase